MGTNKFKTLPEYIKLFGVTVLTDYYIRTKCGRGEYEYIDKINIKREQKKTRKLKKIYERAMLDVLNQVELLDEYAEQIKTDFTTGKMELIK